jgi:nicotinate-nucleotide pyrophosphorylase (carboxylating)
MIREIVDRCLKEDIGEGDHSSLACVPEGAKGKAYLLVKDTGVIAGVELAEAIFNQFDDRLKFTRLIEDGVHVEPGDVVFEVEGPSRSILSTERLVLNFMQRMSGIATLTRKMTDLIIHTNTTLLDTRKTTPGIRYMEKWAVRIGGGANHRFGLYDMVMLKDNHIDYAGGLVEAVQRTKEYLKENNKDLKIEVEVRDMVELNKALSVSGVHRIMLDNFTPAELAQALKKIPNHIETEASGGITDETIASYAETGVQFISSGALTHSAGSLDMSLKANYEV